jgi:hypothetical protein
MGARPGATDAPLEEAVALESPQPSTITYTPYTVKKGLNFPVSSRDVTDQTLPVRE